MSIFRKGSAVAALVAVVALVGAVAAFGSSNATTAVKVTAGKPGELKFTVSKKAALHGTVVFTITNKGKLTHNFKIAGKVTKKLAPGKSATLRLVIKKKGKYTYVCTLPGHAAAGMKGVFTVK